MPQENSVSAEIIIQESFVEGYNDPSITGGRDQDDERARLGIERAMIFLKQDSTVTDADLAAFRTAGARQPLDWIYAGLTAVLTERKAR